MTTNNELMMVNIPFMGFYESIHDVLFDDHIDQMHEDDEIMEEQLDNIDWCKVRLAYSEDYINAIDNRICLDVDCTLTFKELHSPKFYNYTTDTITATITREGFTSLLDAVKMTDLKELINDKFTSREGFISNYSNRLVDWMNESEHDLYDWDAVQVGTLLECVLIAEYDVDWEHDLIESQNLTEAARNAVDNELCKDS